MEDIIKIINENGWAEVENIHSEIDLLNLAEKLGTIIKHPNDEKISYLTPKKKAIAVKGTFSNQFGFDRFPLHTDTAFWAIPARYVILNSVEVSNSNTQIVQFSEVWNQLSEVDKSYSRKAVFIIKTIHNQHYSSLIFRDNGIDGFRFDPCTMIPFNESAKKIYKILEGIINNVEVNEVQWTGNKALIFDNWKTLHGRSFINEKEQRIIRRIYLN